MAPDINSLPPSPYRSQGTSSNPRRPSQPRRLSERVASPSTSLFSSTPPPRSPVLSSAFNQPPPHEDNTGVDPGPGPLRHPRPLTAADLHMQLEKEQEAVVNRLTRELTLLRQQTASVNSTTSSTSASTGIAEPDPSSHSAYLTSGSAHPTSSRRHRSSSNLSSRGTTSTGAGTSSTSTVNTTGALAGSGIAPPRDSSIPYTYSRGDPNLSRQSSVASRRSEASSPSLSSSLIYQGQQGEHNLPFHHHRHSHSNSTSAQAGAAVTAGASARSGSMGAVAHVPSTARYDDAAHAKAELEMVKAENEALKSRIRELERMATRRGEDAKAQEDRGWNSALLM
ncbi:uncharacterized protein KY384_005408 [Bacidia gigantensis]|uniref:uncharacterized protein n=1 Tax=Bacidia gigantensis TaxID=2732470 RepID=UPI001D04DCC5|nr:uncharacterized protein KY384_005408 [Bacidia gigantensis]KAG8529927.1 hypothetical protein KY384_005408 [Bacidia gigantensis]